MKMMTDRGKKKKTFLPLQEPKNVTKRTHNGGETDEVQGKLNYYPIPTRFKIHPNGEHKKWSEFPIVTSATHEQYLA